MKSATWCFVYNNKKGIFQWEISKQTISSKNIAKLAQRNLQQICFYREIAKKKVKEKIKAKAAMVIKEIIFHPHYWMSNFSCHLKSSKIYSLTTLNVHYCFVFEEMPFLVKISHMAISFNKNKPSSPRIPTILLRIVKSHWKR